MDHGFSSARPVAHKRAESVVVVGNLRLSRVRDPYGAFVVVAEPIAMGREAQDQ